MVPILVRDEFQSVRLFLGIEVSNDRLRLLCKLPRFVTVIESFLLRSKETVKYSVKLESGNRVIGFALFRNLVSLLVNHFTVRKMNLALTCGVSYGFGWKVKIAHGNHPLVLLTTKRGTLVLEFVGLQRTEYEYDSLRRFIFFSGLHLQLL